MEEASSIHSGNSMSWQGNQTTVSRTVFASSMSDDFLSLLSKYCGLSLDKPASLQLVSSVLPAAIALCIFQVPSISSRLRRLPFAVISLVLLVASICSMPASQVADTTLGATFTALQLNDNSSDYQTVLLSTITNQQLPPIPQTHKSNALNEVELSAAGPAQDVRQGDNDPAFSKGAGAGSGVQLSGSMTVAMLPVLLALFLVQAPAAVHARQRQSQAGLVAALAVGLILSLATVDAEPSMCPAVQPVCTAKAAVAVASKPAASKSPAQAAKPPATSSTAVKAPSPAFTPYADTLLAAMGARKEALHVASTPEPTSDVPQRVMPISTTPRMSKALEQQLFTKLLEVLMAPSNTTATNPAPGTAGNSTSQPGLSPRPAISPSVPRAVVQPGDDGLLYLENARLRVGIDMARGGSISHLSSPIMPGTWANVNLINTWDSGRLIQQSYYGCPDGSCWSDRPWRWNPVQGGSWHNYPPKMLSSSTFGGVVTTSSHPRNWGSQQLLDDVVMTTQTSLLPNMVKLRMIMRYTGPGGHPQRHQEVPAVFVDRRLNMLATYTGSAPWTNGQVTFIMPGQTNEYYKPTEGWAAYVDSSTGFGVGVYTPVSDLLVAYRVGGENSTAKSDCSYFAPLVTAAIAPNSEFSYDTYIAVGRVDEMRKWFAAVKAKLPHNLQLQRSLTSSVSTAEEAGRPAGSLRTAAPAAAAAAAAAAAKPAAGRKSSSVTPTFKKVLPGPRTLVMNPVQPLARKFYVRTVKPEPELLPSIRITASKSPPKLTMG